MDELGVVARVAALDRGRWRERAGRVDVLRGAVAGWVLAEACCSGVSKLSQHNGLDEDGGYAQARDSLPSSASLPSTFFLAMVSFNRWIVSCSSSTRV